MGTHFLLTGFSTQQVAPHEINIIARYLFQMRPYPAPPAGRNKFCVNFLGAGTPDLFPMEHRI
jgi:hypothetical protein